MAASGSFGSLVWRFVAVLALLVQLGLVAHRIEHYLVPDQMECGEDSCTAFAPGTGMPDLPVFVAPLILIVFVVRFWTLNAPEPAQPRDRLGFRAHAPPV